MKIKYLCALLLAALIYSCDDSTTGIGTDLIPGGDKIPANTDSYEFTTKSLLKSIAGDCIIDVDVSARTEKHL